MLVLSRKLGEILVMTIPPCTETQTLRIIVTDIDRGKVRLGFVAPYHIKCDREEVFKGKENEKTKTV